MASIDKLIRFCHPQEQTLDLTSSKPEKIYRIEHLDKFTNLKILNLANNMIIKIQNLSHLVSLKILNLQFNQITVLENIKQLIKLEEIFLSYNSIETISPEIRFNAKLKVLHLAYNDIKSIQTIKPLSSLHELSILTITGNPFLSALNYIAFVKMIIPSLLLLDDRDANQSIIAANVYPHQQIVILREALNKLLDERNSHNQSELENFSYSNKIIEKRQSQQIDSPNKQHEIDDQIGVQHILNLFKDWIFSFQKKIEIKRVQISDLSQIYSQMINSNKDYLQNPKIYQLLVQKIKKYKQKQQKGQLSIQKKYKLKKMLKQLQQRQQTQLKYQNQSRNILNNLKSRQFQYGKLKQKQNILKKLRQKIEKSNRNPSQLLMMHILFGYDNPKDFSYKQIRKHLFEAKGLIKYVQDLNTIIFGEIADHSRAIKLKQFLGDKSLIQIINNLKDMGLRYKKDKKRYQKQRNKLIQQFETQAHELCQQWKQIQKQKWIMKNSRNVQISTNSFDDKFQSTEIDDKNRIQILKKDKQHYENRVNQLKQKNDQLQNEFQRKYKQLQQFQQFFEQFKKQKQIIVNLKQQIQQFNKQLYQKKQLLDQINDNIKEFKFKQESLMEKSAFYQRKCFQKSQELKIYQQKLKNTNDKLKRINQQFNLTNYQCIKIQDNLRQYIDQTRDYQKKIQRYKASLQMYEEKYKNLHEIQNNKKAALVQLQKEIEEEKKFLSDLLCRIEESQMKLNRYIQASYQYQLKINQSKKNIESLSDINKTLSDMLDRQNHLKKVNLELQLQNQHLLQFKDKLIKQIKFKYDDKDESL